MVSPRTPDVLSRNVSRRALFRGAGLMAVGAGLAGCTNIATAARVRQETYENSDLLLVSVIQTATNDYMQDWAFGSRVFARYIGSPIRVINSNGDSSQQYSQIQSAAATGKRLVLNLEPLASADVPGIARAVSRSGGYICSSWDKPAGVTPADVGPGWVAHMGFDGIAAGEFIARRLFESMGGNGGIIALKGVLDSTASKQRFAGLQKALQEYPHIELLGVESANWDRQTAYAKASTLLSKYAGKVSGIWAGSDSMTLGAIAAAKSAGIDVKAVGIDGLQEAVEIIKAGGPIVASWYSDGRYSGMLGLAIAHAAATGQLDVAKMTPQQRDGTYRQVGVDATNVDRYLTAPDYETLIAEYRKGLFDRLTGPPITGS
jgi:ribose transport system substrate-binding protein